MKRITRFSLEICIGDTILVGRSRTPTEVTKIEYHPQSGQLNLGTTLGPRRAFTFSLPDTTPEGADKYR